MQKKSLFKDLYAFIPLLISGLICIALLFLFWQKMETDSTFATTLESIRTIFIGVSGFLAAVLMGYLVFIATRLKNNQKELYSTLGAVTQKMHVFREIIELLFRSKIWLPGLATYIDDEFEGLTFFDVKEFYKGKSRLAIEFLQESHNYQDTENFYLELKSLLMTNPKDKRVPETLHYPKVYSNDMVAKWLEHKCGSGLWYYFGFKYAVFKQALDLDAVYERHQDKIMTLANSIDNKAFEDSSFNEVFLSKLGEYMTKQVMPKLFQFQEQSNGGMPSKMTYVYGVFVTLVVLGVLLPLLSFLLTLSPILLMISYAVIISLIFFVATSLYPFLLRETRH